MNTLQLGEFDYYFVKVAVANMFAELLGRDAELWDRYGKFLQNFEEKVEQQVDTTGVREHFESREFSIETLFNLLKQLDK